MHCGAAPLKQSSLRWLQEPGEIKRHTIRTPSLHRTRLGHRMTYLEPRPVRVVQAVVALCAVCVDTAIAAVATGIRQHQATFNSNSLVIPDMSQPSSLPFGCRNSRQRSGVHTDLAQCSNGLDDTNCSGLQIRHPMAQTCSLKRGGFTFLQSKT